MIRNRPLKSDLGRIVATGAIFMVMAYLLDCFINAAVTGENVVRQIISPGSRELAARVAFLSVLLLFIGYVSDLLIRRKSLEKALVKYQAGMDASMDGIFILNGRFEYTYLNEAQAMLHGYYSRHEAIGKQWHLFYGDEEIRRFEGEVFPLLFAKGEWRGEAAGRRSDGSTFPQEISLTAVGGNSVVAIVRDITEHKKFESELKRQAEELALANRELEAFSYSLSHDMRNHITRIYSAAQLLRDQYQAAMDENGRYLVNLVCDANEDLDRLIEDMMVLSRIVQAEVSREKVDLSEMACGIASGLRLAGPDRQVEFDIAPDLVAVCDPQLVKVALDNLFSNAWKYTGMTPQARIEFGAVDSNGRRAFFVRDNGLGFDMDDADNLFKPFLRLQNAKAFPGTGIGLATVQRVIERHGGGVWGEGEEGKGATFFFTLPG